MKQCVGVGRCALIPAGKSRLVSAGDEELALWNVEGAFYAFRNVCPHQHFSKLHEGTIEDGFLVCPMHGWSFNLKDGSEKSGRGRAKVYEVEIRNGELFVLLDDPSGREAG